LIESTQRAAAKPSSSQKHQEASSSASTSKELQALEETEATKENTVAVLEKGGYQFSQEEVFNAMRNMIITQESNEGNQILIQPVQPQATSATKSSPRPKTMLDYFVLLANNHTKSTRDSGNASSSHDGSDDVNQDENEGEENTGKGKGKSKAKEPKEKEPAKKRAPAKKKSTAAKRTKRS